MSTFDYTGSISTATELITKFGRRVKFLRASSTPSDVSKPWRGDDIATEAVLDGDDVIAAIVPFDEVDDSDSVRAGTKTVYVSASVFPDDDGETYDRMIEIANGESWHLHSAEIVNPGDKRVLYIFKGEQ